MRKQYEVVIEVMRHNGGFATLGFLYENVLQAADVEWKTKTPFASIRRIVQDRRIFFKIRPGLWALKEFRDRLPAEVISLQKTTKGATTRFNHTYYQGLLLEIGNLKKLSTFVPAQDKNKIFLNRALGKVSSLNGIYQFAYSHLLRKVQTIDVIWFNARKMPDSFFEIEYSTDMQRSLLKFVELQDFYVQFFIVSDKAREREYHSKVSLSAFHPIINRTKFVSFDQVSLWHSTSFELRNIESTIR